MNSPAAPVTGQEYLDAVIGRLQRQDRDGAIALARRALDENLEHATFYNLRAFWHELAGRFYESLADLERAHAMAPEDVPVLNAYGLALGRVRRYREAAEKFQAAADVDPSFRPAYINLGFAYERLGELDAARAAYEFYLTLDPKHPGVHASLAALAARRSDWASVRRHASAAFAADPHQSNAHYAMALAEMAEEGAEPAIKRLSPLADHPGLGALERALLRGALADAYHQALDFDQAFRWYSAAAQDLSAGHAGEFAKEGRESVAHYVERISVYVGQAEAHVTKSIRPETPPSPGRPSSHTFLIGFPRSGTTLLESVVGAHPDVGISEEREGFGLALRDFMSLPDGIAQLCALSAAELQRYRSSYWTEMEAAGADVSRRVFLDKYPLNTIKLPLIARLFPESKVLFAVRDPRDVVLSCFRRRFAMNPAMYEFTGLERAARFYNAVMTFMTIARPAFDLNLMYVKYEDFVREFEAKAFEVCKFIDVPWTDDVRAFAEKAKARSISTPSSTQVGRGIYQEGAGQWRFYRRHLQPVMPILAPWIERFGYAAD